MLKSTTFNINKNLEIKNIKLGQLGQTQKLLLVLVVMNFLWGAAWVPYKVVLSELPVPVFACLRLILAVILLAPWAWRDLQAHYRAGGMRFGWRRLPRLFALTLVGVVLNNVFLYNGASLAPATDASLLAITETLFTAFLAWLFLKEKFPALKMLGLGLGAFGVYLLVAQGLYLPDLSGSGQALGDLLLLVGFAFESLYTLLGASSARRFPPLALIVATNLTGLLFWTPAALVSMQSRDWVLPTLDWQGWAGLAYLVIVCSVVGYAIWFKTLRHAEASVASITLFVQPLSGSLVGFALLGEVFSMFNLVGGSLIVFSLGLIAFSASRKNVQSRVQREAQVHGMVMVSASEYVALGAGAELSARFGETFEQVVGSVEEVAPRTVPPSSNIRPALKTASR